MKNSAQHPKSNLNSFFQPATVGLAITILFALAFIAAQPAKAQTFQVLYNIAGGENGELPNGGLAMDRAGNLYGTTATGGAQSCYCGIVFMLKRSVHGWTFNPIHRFTGGSDGSYPQATVVFGPDGALYGTTGGGGHGYGTVYSVRPKPTACTTALCPWSETVLYKFLGGPSDGYLPTDEVVFDQEGNLYGTTSRGGSHSNSCTYGGGDCGTVFKMVPSNGGWTESLLYSFTGADDGSNPYAGLTLDAAGNLYGTALINGANSGGTVFQLTPSGSGWTEKTLYSFNPQGNGGYEPLNGLIFDPQGNLYGGTPTGGAGGAGTVFELTPLANGWSFNLLYSFFGGESGAAGNLLMDSAGNLFGTAYSLYTNGLIYKLTPSNGSWTYTVLHQFNGQDGQHPSGAIIMDAQGNLYGTTFSGGKYNWGVVWEITP
jgi:uncharacterized repeat protein (TIGR03803 family)